MLKTFLSQLESRVQAIEKLLGPISEYSEKEVREIRDGITDFSAKLPKDIGRKCKKAINQLTALKRTSRSITQSSILSPSTINLPLFTQNWKSWTPSPPNSHKSKNWYLLSTLTTTSNLEKTTKTCIFLALPQHFRNHPSIKSQWKRKAASLCCRWGLNTGRQWTKFWNLMAK